MIQGIDQKQKILIAFVLAGMDSISNKQVDIALYLVNHAKGNYYVGDYKTIAKGSGTTFPTVKSILHRFTELGLIIEKRVPTVGRALGMWDIEPLLTGMMEENL